VLLCDQHKRIKKSTNFTCYSVALDDTQDVTGTEQLAIVREVVPDFNIYEDFLTLRSVHGLSKGGNMFCNFRASLEEERLDSSKLFAIGAGGALQWRIRGGKQTALQPGVPNI